MTTQAAVLPIVFNSHIHMWDKPPRHRGCQGRAPTGFTKALPRCAGKVGSTHGAREVRRQRRTGEFNTKENQESPECCRARGACCHRPDAGSSRTSSRLVPMPLPSQGESVAFIRPGDLVVWILGFQLLRSHGVVRSPKALAEERGSGGELVRLRPRGELGEPLGRLSTTRGSGRRR